jgi:hypothetical protein
MKYLPCMGRDRRNLHSMGRRVVLTGPAYTTLYLEQ